MRALVIEDEAAIQMLMVDYLVDAGIEVLDTACRIDDAMHKAATLDFDVAVLDVNLIGHPSYPVAAVLKSRNIPFVFATGYGRAGLPAELEDMALLRKPFTQEQFNAALRSLIVEQASPDKAA
jgi:DNA-binding response OmpR family regulator